MKVSICGKGGCGKSTLTSLLAKALARREKEVLVIDSDESNYGLHRQLGVELPGDFTEYFGGKETVLNDMMLSKFTHQFFQETWTMKDIPEKYYSMKDGVKLDGQREDSSGQRGMFLRHGDGDDTVHSESADFKGSVCPS